jgi:hypothetical protein
MPKAYYKGDPAAWKKKLAVYKLIRQEDEESVALSDKESWDLHERLGTAEETLLAQPAPDIDAVIFKLTKVIWDDDELHSDIDYGRGKRTVLDDLRRLKACCGGPDKSKH